MTSLSTSLPEPRSDYRLAVVIGRFQMPHHGHLALIRHALNTAPLVLCFLGSSLRASDCSNTFDFSTRKALLLSALSPSERARIHFVPLRDYYDDVRWCESVLNSCAQFLSNPQTYLLSERSNDSRSHYSDPDGTQPSTVTIGSFLSQYYYSKHPAVATYLIDTLLDRYPQWSTLDIDIVHQRRSPKPQCDLSGIALVGHFKDNSSYYLRLFPQFHLVQAQSVYMPDVQPPTCIDATPLRERFLTNANDFFEHPSAQLVPDSMWEVLKKFSHTPNYQRTQRLQTDLKAYKQQYSQPVALTADCIVTHQHDVLLIARNSRFGDGLLAMPGGFCEPQEFLHQCAVRELQEETELVLQNHTHRFLGSHMATHPKRSERMRIISEVFHYALLDPIRPKVQGQDDARGAHFFAIEHLPLLEPLFFEDHFCHLQKRLSFEPLDCMALSRLL